MHRITGDDIRAALELGEEKFNGSYGQSRRKPVPLCTCHFLLPLRSRVADFVLVCADDPSMRLDDGDAPTDPFVLDCSGLQPASPIVKPTPPKQNPASQMAVTTASSPVTTTTAPLVVSTTTTTDVKFGPQPLPPPDTTAAVVDLNPQLMLQPIAVEPNDDDEGSNSDDHPDILHSPSDSEADDRGGSGSDSGDQPESEDFDDGGTDTEQGEWPNGCRAETDRFVDISQRTLGQERIRVDLERAFLSSLQTADQALTSTGAAVSAVGHDHKSDSKSAAAAAADTKTGAPNSGGDTSEQLTFRAFAAAKRANELSANRLVSLQKQHGIVPDTSPTTGWDPLSAIRWRHERDTDYYQVDSDDDFEALLADGRKQRALIESAAPPPPSAASSTAAASTAAGAAPAPTSRPMVTAMRAGASAKWAEPLVRPNETDSAHPQAVATAQKLLRETRLGDDDYVWASWALSSHVPFGGVSHLGSRYARPRENGVGWYDETETMYERNQRVTGKTPPTAGDRRRMEIKRAIMDTKSLVAHGEERDSEWLGHDSGSDVECPSGDETPDRNTEESAEEEVETNEWDEHEQRALDSDAGAETTDDSQSDEPTLITPSAGSGGSGTGSGSGGAGTGSGVKYLQAIGTYVQTSPKALALICVSITLSIVVFGLLFSANRPRRASCVVAV